MSTIYRVFTVLLLSPVFTTQGYLYGHYVARCQFISPDGHDAVYLEQFSFNKVLIMQYNSTLEKVVGYTKYAEIFAELFNNDKKLMSLQKWKTGVCKKSVPLAYNSLLNPAEPYIKLRSAKAASSEHPGLLVCSVYNFYPKQIKVTWLRDGKEITSGVTSTDELSNGNWLYQLHSHLEYTPRPGEKITCKVEHASFKQPKLRDWDPLPDPGTKKIAGGTVGMLLGLFILVGGIIYNKKKSEVNHPSSHSSGSALSAEPAVVDDSVAFIPVSCDSSLLSDSAPEDHRRELSPEF